MRARTLRGASAAAGESCLSHQTEKSMKEKGVKWCMPPEPPTCAPPPSGGDSVSSPSGGDFGGRAFNSLRRRRREEGSGTILTVGVCAAAVFFALVIGAYGAEASTRARLDAIADLAALAGADVSATAQWEDVGARPCEEAGAVVAKNGAVLDSCEILGTHTRVIVSSTVKLMGVSVPVRARARAGPKE